MREARSFEASAACQCYDQMWASVGRGEQKEWRSDATNDRSRLREVRTSVKLSAPSFSAFHADGWHVSARGQSVGLSHYPCSGFGGRSHSSDEDDETEQIHLAGRFLAIVKEDGDRTVAVFEDCAVASRVQLIHGSRPFYVSAAAPARYLTACESRSRFIRGAYVQN